MVALMLGATTYAFTSMLLAVLLGLTLTGPPPEEARRIALA